MKIYGLDSSNETVNIYGGNQHYIALGAGENKVLIANGKNHEVHTGNDKDRITLQNNAHVGYLVTSGGDDVITIESGAYVNNNNNDWWSLRTNDGADTVTIKAGAGNNSYVRTDEGNDKIYIRGGNNHKVWTGDGTDTIEVTGGSGHEIQLESGKNNVTVSAKDVTLHMSHDADDSITLNWGKSKGLYTINGTENNSIAATDTLTINNAKFAYFTFEATTDWYKDLLLTSSDGSKILIEGWAKGTEKTSFSGIKFADGFKSFDTINKQAKLS